MEINVRRLGVTAVLAWVFFDLSTFFCSAAGNSPPQAFVAVSQYYVLYTYPVIPYLDKHGAFMVGLEGFGRVIDHDATPHQEPPPGVERYATVTTDAAARTEVLTFNGSHLTFRAGSSTLDADGKQIPMSAAAVWDRQAGQMVVPLAPLAHALGLGTHWDPRLRVLRVTGLPDLTEELDRGDEGDDIQDEINDRGEIDNMPLNTHALVPVSTRLRPDLATVMEPGEHLAFTFQNISDATLGQDEWLNLDVLFANDGASPHGDSSYHVTNYARGPVPPIPPFGTRTLTVGLDLPQVVHPSRQIQFTNHALCVVADPVTLAPAQAPGSISAEPSLGGLPPVDLSLIDPAIQGYAREVVVGAMAGIRPEDRRNGLLPADRRFGERISYTLSCPSILSPLILPHG